MEENREKSIVNKVVVVTGGSRGIGAQIVKTLANENYKVIYFIYPTSQLLYQLS